MVKKLQWFCGWGGFISQTKGMVGFGWFWLVLVGFWSNCDWNSFVKKYCFRREKILLKNGLMKKYDKTVVLENPKLWRRRKMKLSLKIRNQIVTKHKNLNCDKAQQLLFWQDNKL